ncbi:hypothetical protein [Streptomyces sp. FIT100]|uniref:hypothetical protein n=1 Tax=Streptomyces sp. FIT100 TaxID=2837956 RepID=UPI0021C7670F|nr:hypothetical protein [Streptomyces sp. FIT100]UUN28804.1 hypothetical protein KK483_22290 [Streptomyces sp. FIT100]
MRAHRRVRLISGLTALLAAVGLVVLPPTGGAGQARAAELEDSAITVNGKEGAYEDFSGLRVTVHQTKGLRSQGVKVSWEGGKETAIGFPANYLQIMQCWGDDPEGPEREQCQFGSAEKSNDAQYTGDRIVGMESAASSAFDPNETEYPHSGTVGGFGWVPFRPATGEPPTTAPNDATYFSKYTTNEQPWLNTGPDGTGETVFEMQTALQAAHLGCGAVEAGKVGRCWLVIVPRGEYEASGAHLPDSRLKSSALSTSNWANRMVVPLEFEPIGTACPLELRSRPTYGSEMAQEATGSWQAALCDAENLSYNHVVMSDSQARVKAATGLSLTQLPVTTGEDEAPVVHAPLTVSGLVVGYSIEYPGSTKQVPRLRLTARLVAKLLTYSYHEDLPGPNGVPREGLSEGNPRRLRLDPEFLDLNPEMRQWSEVNLDVGIMLPAGNSDYGQMLWSWLRSDKQAREFLAGEADPWGMTVNPYYLDLHLDNDEERTDFPKADQYEYQPPRGCTGLKISLLDHRPYTGSLHNAALRTRRGYNGMLEGEDCTATPPKLIGNPQRSGQRFQLSLVDSATAALYGLGTAELRNANGEWVAPSTESFTKAVAGMKKGPEGVLDQDPGLETKGAYPLTAVTYGAASTGMGAELRTEYADLIRYAAGPGQSPGIEPGQLPPGYAPLSKDLREQAVKAADELARKRPQDSGGSTASGGAGGSSGNGGGTSGSDAGTSAGAGAGGPEGGSTGGNGTDSASPSPAAGGPSPGPSDPENIAQTGPATPEKILGIIRWVLLATLIAGVAGAVAGPILMRVGVMRAAGAPGSHLEGNSPMS